MDWIAKDTILMYLGMQALHTIHLQYPRPLHLPHNSPHQIRCSWTSSSLPLPPPQLESQRPSSLQYQPSLTQR
jgi:hypothetical protein